MKRAPILNELVIQAAAEAQRATADSLSFGKAGSLCVGPDAEIRQGCAAMLETFHWFMTKGHVNDYETTVARLETRAQIVASLPASSPAGIRAKATIVAALNDFGMACYAGRILGASLGRDLLREAQP